MFVPPRKSATKRVDEPVFHLADVNVRTHLLHHPIVTLGYRIEHDGRSVVDATDHELYRRMYELRGRSEDMRTLADRHDADFAAFVEGADLYIAEAQYTVEEYPSKVGWGHSTVDDIVALALRAGVRHLALYHHDPMRTDDGVDTLLATAHATIAAARSAMVCVAAREGETLAL